MSPSRSVLVLFPIVVLAIFVARPFQSTEAQGGPFRLEEATSADVHRAIKAGQITCRGIVQAYRNQVLLVEKPGKLKHARYEGDQQRYHQGAFDQRRSLLIPPE
jgi:hypothetical protein